MFLLWKWKSSFYSMSDILNSIFLVFGWREFGGFLECEHYEVHSFFSFLAYGACVGCMEFSSS